MLDIVRFSCPDNCLECKRSVDIWSKSIYTPCHSMSSMAASNIKLMWIYVLQLQIAQAHACVQWRRKWPNLIALKCLFSDAQYHRTVEFSLKVENYQMATKNVSFHYYLIHITSNCANNTHFHSKNLLSGIQIARLWPDWDYFYRNYPPKRPSYMWLVVWRHLCK